MSFPHSNVVTRSSTWKLLTVISLAFWLSGSVLLGAVVMPSLYVTGMMAQSSFASAGYTLFGLFNHVELVCAALALTGVFVLRGHQDSWHRKGYAGVVLASILLLITLIETYALTPQMSAMGLQLNLFGEALLPPAMGPLHLSYWLLDTLKILAGGALLGLCSRDRI